MTTVQRIREIVADHYDVIADSILGPRRFANVAWARQVAMHFTKLAMMQSSPNISDADIGLMFNRTGGDVRHALKQVKNICETEALIEQDLAILEQKIEDALCEQNGNNQGQRARSFLLKTPMANGEL